jgi:hypothetical protein
MALPAKGHASAKLPQRARTGSAKRKPMFASDYDMSRFWKYQDLGELGSSALTDISDVTEETLKSRDGEEDVKPCIWCEVNDKLKGLALNTTNRNTLVEAYGDDMLAWIGKPVILFSQMTDFGGKQVGCIRVRIPKANGSRHIAKKHK